MWTSPLLNDRWVPSRAMLVYFFTLHDRRASLGVHMIAFFLSLAPCFPSDGLLLALYDRWVCLKNPSDHLVLALASYDRRVLVSHLGRP